MKLEIFCYIFFLANNRFAYVFLIIFSCKYNQCIVLNHRDGSTVAQWLSGRVFDSRPRGRGFEPHRRHFVVVLEQDTFILA